MNKTFKLAEFFSGPGGMGYGAGLSKVKSKKIPIQLSMHGLLTTMKLHVILIKKILKQKQYFVKKLKTFLV